MSDAPPEAAANAPRLARRPVLLGRGGRGPSGHPALRRLRHAAPPTGADVRRLRLAAVGHRRVVGARPHRVVDHVAAPEPSRRRAAHRDPRAAGGRHPAGLEPARRGRRALRRPPGGRRLPRRPRRAHPVLPGASRGRRDRHHRRRHRRHRVLEGVGPQRDAARRRGQSRCDPRRRPHARRHRRHGHLHRRRQRRAGADAQPRCGSGHLVVACTGRRHRSVRGDAAGGGGGGRRPGEQRARVPRLQRAVRVPLRATARDGRAAAPRLVPQLRRRHAGEDVRALVPSLHARVRRHQRGLRPLHRVGAAVRGDQPEGVVPRPTDHPRGPSGLALDRGTGAAPLRLLPGERRRCRARGDPRRPRRRRRRAGGHPCGRRRRATPTPASPRTTTTTTSRRIPKRRSARSSCSTRSGLTAADIDVAEIYENFSPLVFLRARGLRVLRSR